MLDAIKYHFRHLADFTGRDARQTFWYWFLFVFILNMVVSFAATVPVVFGAMSAGFAAARSGDPAASQAAIMTQMAGTMSGLVYLSLALGVANVVLLAAPFVRRLHDSGKSGLWAALAGLLYLGSLVVAWSLIDETAAVMRQVAAGADPSGVFPMQGKIAWQSLLKYVPLIMLIGFGVLKSDPGPNRYGGEPVRF